MRKSRRVKSGPPCPHMQLIFRLSSLFGLSPLVFEKGNSKFSYILAAYSIIFTCVVAFIGWLDFYFSSKIYNDFSVSIIARMNIFIYSALQISSLIDAYINAAEYGRIFEQLKVIDGKLTAIGALKFQSLNWSNLFLMAVMIFLYFVVGLTMSQDVFTVFRYTTISSYTLVCAQVIIVESHILSRYELVIRTLSQLNDSSQNTNDIVDILLSINHRLSRIVNAFSSCYRLQLLFLTTFTFCFVSSRLYFVYFFHNKLTTNLLIFYLISFACVQFLRITRCSSAIMDKVKCRLNSLLSLIAV